MLPQFYQKIATLNAKQHGGLSLQMPERFDFATGGNVIHLQVWEFVKALSTYPIVFVGEGEQLFARALTGLGEAQNLFIDEAGAWSAAYIPAYVRRYPFIIANIAEGKSTVCIDQDYAGFNREGKGEALFTEQGEQSEFLKQQVAFLKDFEQASAQTRLFCQQLNELDLLEPMSAQIQPKAQPKAQPDAQSEASSDNEAPFVVQGFRVVSREKLGKLSAETLKQLNDNGALESIYRHLASLEQFEALLVRYNRSK